MADNKNISYSSEDNYQNVGVCPACGQIITRGDESSNGGVHKECDKEDKD